MQVGRRLETKDVALIACFTGLNACFCLIPAFPIVGSSGAAITLAAITSPVIGIILGEYLGMLSTALGGIIAWFFASSFFPPSFVSGIVTAFFAGMLYRNKRGVCVLMYFSLLFLFGFCPFVGPVWLYPPFMWFQIAGFLLLVSPLPSIVSRNIKNSNNHSKLLFAFFIICLTSTLAGQIAGSLTFELMLSDPDTLKPIWQTVAFLYPIERTIIASSATFVVAFLYKVLSSTNFISFFDQESHNWKRAEL